MKTQLIDKVISILGGNDEHAKRALESVINAVDPEKDYTVVVIAPQECKADVELHCAMDGIETIEHLEALVVDTKEAVIKNFIQQQGLATLANEKGAIVVPRG